MHRASAREVGFAPIAPEERVQSLVVVGGVGRFGIIVVNNKVKAPNPTN